ncbi:MAG: universal stress protein [Pseudomonadota bacterium]
MGLLVIVSNLEAPTRDAIAQAARLAGKIDAALRVLAPMPDPAGALIYAGPEVMVGALARGEIQNAQTALIADLSEMTTQICAEAGLSEQKYQFEHQIGAPPILVAHAAILADATILPAHAASARDWLNTSFEKLLMDSRLPLVLASVGAPGDGPAIIAWDGSPEAARAVRFHEGVYRQSSGVVIAQHEGDLSSFREGEAADPARLEAWLSRRGIVSERATLKGEVAAGLLDLAEARSASLLVMGAYGHSRAGQFLFGGVTRTMLRTDERPPLALAH